MTSAPDATNHPPGTTGAADRSGRGPVRIILVEDDTGLRTLLRNYLASEGKCSIKEAGSVSEAQRLLQAPPLPDAVISDIRLPDGTGEELLEWCRREHLLVPFVLMTAFHSYERAVTAFRLGAVRYLRKPFDLKEFRDAIEEALELGAVLDPPLAEVKEQTRGWIEIAGPSTENTAERMREFVAVLSSSLLTQKEVDDLRLAVEEMVQNAIEWGNLSDPGRKVAVSYAVFSDRLIIKVSDEGEGFDLENLPDPRQDPIGHLKARLASGKRIGGYGITLTREMVDEVLYGAKGNVVLLTKYLRRSGDGT